MDISLYLPSDPNANKNRIPEKKELHNLRNLAQDNLQLINDLDRQLERQRNDCAAIQRRYEKQTRAIESIRSELSAMNKSLEMLEKQKREAQSELDQLQGLIHPIRSCPSDILQHIFESTVEMQEPNWFTAATRLSHVCRRWRNIALNTPYLWICLCVSLKNPAGRVKELWERTMTRVKAVAISIFIVDIDGANSRWRVMEECNFDVFPHIEHLEFDISNRDAVMRLASPQLRPPMGRLDKLSLQYTGNARDAPLDLSPILSRFSSIASLSLTGTPTLAFKAGFVAPAVTKLVIKKTKAGSINVLAQTFPNVEVVELREVEFQSDVVGIVSWPKLWSLSNIRCDNSSWGSLWTPNITYLFWYGKRAIDLGVFITSHPSLQHLDMVYNNDHINAITTVAPRLLTLAIDSCEEIGDKSIMAFDKLTDLTIYHSVKAPLTLDRFEKIVHSHFLPKRKNEGQCPSLTIVVNAKVESKDIKWRDSGLLSFATLSVSTTVRSGSKYHEYLFDWNASSC